MSTLPQLLSLARRPALGRILVAPNFFHLRMMDDTVLGDLQCCRYPSPDLCLDAILFRSSTNNSFDLMAWLLLWHALSIVGPYIDRCVPFQIMSKYTEFTTAVLQVVETSQGWSMETELNFKSHYFCFRFLTNLQTFLKTGFCFVIMGYCDVDWWGQLFI